MAFHLRPIRLVLSYVFARGLSVLSGRDQRGLRVFIIGCVVVRMSVHLIMYWASCWMTDGLRAWWGVCCHKSPPHTVIHPTTPLNPKLLRPLNALQCLPLCQKSLQKGSCLMTWITTFTLESIAKNQDEEKKAPCLLATVAGDLSQSLSSRSAQLAACV